jgi:hypothetical protein
VEGSWICRVLGFGYAGFLYIFRRATPLQVFFTCSIQYFKGGRWKVVGYAVFWSLDLLVFL